MDAGERWAEALQAGCVDVWACGGRTCGGCSCPRAGTRTRRLPYHRGTTQGLSQAPAGPEWRTTSAICTVTKVAPPTYVPLIPAAAGRRGCCGPFITTLFPNKPTTSLSYPFQLVPGGMQHIQARPDSLGADFFSSNLACWCLLPHAPPGGRQRAGGPLLCLARLLVASPISSHAGGAVERGRGQLRHRGLRWDEGWGMRGE